MRNYYVIDILLLLAIIALKANDAAWTRFDAKAFFLNLEGLGGVKFSVAKRYCNVIGGRLYQPQLSELNILQFLNTTGIPDLTNIGPPFAFFIGIERISWNWSGFQFVESGAVPRELLQYWAPGQPQPPPVNVTQEKLTHTAVLMGDFDVYDQNLLWRNVPKNVTARFICEKSYDPEKDGAIPNKTTAESEL